MPQEFLTNGRDRPVNSQPPPHIMLGTITGYEDRAGGRIEGVIAG